MSSTYTSILRLEKQGSGENASTWGEKLNDSVIDLVDSAVGAVTSIDLSGVGTAFTVSTADGAADQARSAVLYFHGSVSTAVSITVPAVDKTYIFSNRTAGGHDLKLKPAGGNEGTIPAGQTTLIYTDGTTVKNLFTSITGMSQVGASLGSFTSVAADLIKADVVGVSVSLSATNIRGVTGSFTTKVSAAALEISGVTSLGALRGTTATFSGAVSVSTIAGDGSALTGLSTLPVNYLSGMNLSNGSDSDHDINITSGGARNSTDASSLTLSSTFVKQIDATWANGSAAGGLASGVSLSANTWYHVHTIAVTAGTDVGFDTSPVAANLIANNDASAYRRIGAVYTDSSSNIRGFKQKGDKFLYDQPILSYTSINIGAGSRTTLTLNSPVSVSTEVIFNHINFGLFTEALYAYRPLSMTDVSVVDNGTATAPTSAAMGTLANYGAGYVEYGDNARIRDFTWEGVCETNLSSQIGIRTQVAGGSADGAPENAFQTTGWYDSRGKDG